MPFLNQENPYEQIPGDVKSNVYETIPISSNTENTYDTIKNEHYEETD